jgi:hypothetical protein
MPALFPMPALFQLASTHREGDTVRMSLERRE